MRILIVGAGAVGGFYGTKLTLAGEVVTFLARGKALEALRKHDLVIKSFRGDFHSRVMAVDSLEGYAPPDLAILAVKSYDTDAAIERIRPVVGPGTLLLSFQNGVENEIKLGQAFGKEKVLGCVCYIGAEVVEPGVILHNARGTVSIGEMDGSKTLRLEGVVDAFHKARIEASASDDILKDLWTKLSWNTAFNQVCTIARATVGSVLDSEVLRQLLGDTMKEVFAVAAKHGVMLTEDLIDSHLTLSSEELRSVKPSMLQDFERGRRLEHETFSGFIVREGKKLGVPTPINTILYEFLSFLDASSEKELNL
jgi:2-dehydropantoate 2-reductase